MANTGSRLSANKDEVVSKVIDGEAIIINLSNGVYYSIAKVGAEIWNLILDGTTADEILSDICSRYAIDQAVAKKDLDGMLKDLADENLLIETVDAEGAETPVDIGSGDRLDYETPTLQIYRDMGDLLALDPPQPGLENTPWKETGDSSPGQ